MSNQRFFDTRPDITHWQTNGLSIESPAAVLNSMDTMDSAAVPGRSSNICDQAFCRQPQRGSNPCLHLERVVS
jgi:hypothetical protein